MELVGEGEPVTQKRVSERSGVSYRTVNGAHGWGREGVEAYARTLRSLAIGVTADQVGIPDGVTWAEVPVLQISLADQLAGGEFTDGLLEQGIAIEDVASSVRQRVLRSVWMAGRAAQETVPKWEEVGINGTVAQIGLEVSDSLRAWPHPDEFLAYHRERDIAKARAAVSELAGEEGNGEWFRMHIAAQLGNVDRLQDLFARWQTNPQGRRADTLAQTPAWEGMILHALDLMDTPESRPPANDAMVKLLTAHAENSTGGDREFREKSMIAWLRGDAEFVFARASVAVRDPSGDGARHSASPDFREPKFANGLPTELAALELPMLFWASGAARRTRVRPTLAQHAAQYLQVGEPPALMKHLTYIAEAARPSDRAAPLRPFTKDLSELREAVLLGAPIDRELFDQLDAIVTTWRQSLPRDDQAHQQGGQQLGAP
ncbi:hypothetical protein [Enemella evansiae]|uniref:hypothetical protein n=1 Tax=Enemella evansiae TaxID=2016499 RepID=UPI000B968EB7|nr:hypothetical protein [Enemella evansiae]OYO02621.1 hypothetical protein CGZ97_14535 [Enemella evansiae]